MLRRGALLCLPIIKIHGIRCWHMMLLSVASPQHWRSLSGPGKVTDRSNATNVSASTQNHETIDLWKLRKATELHEVWQLHKKCFVYISLNFLIERPTKKKLVPFSLAHTPLLQRPIFTKYGFLFPVNIENLSKAIYPSNEPI